MIASRRPGSQSVSPSERGGSDGGMISIDVLAGVILERLAHFHTQSMEKSAADFITPSHYAVASHLHILSPTLQSHSLLNWRLKSHLRQIGELLPEQTSESSGIISLIYLLGRFPLNINVFCGTGRRWKMVGLPGFEPGSIAPKATSIDQTNPQAPSMGPKLQS